MWTEGEEILVTSLDTNESNEDPSALNSPPVPSTPLPPPLIPPLPPPAPPSSSSGSSLETSLQIQEYVQKLTKLKSKVKLSRRNADNSFVGLVDSIPVKKDDNFDNIHNDDDDDDNDDGDNNDNDGDDDDVIVVDDEDNADDGNENDKNINVDKIKSSKAKSNLLQKKLAENRRIFQQRNKELFESKRAAEEKVEEIRQQINDTDLSIEKDKKFIELNDKINELQATIIDLQENLKEKDSVIDSKTRAITLMSEDLSKKGKTTLDTLEETKSEMRLMQENFIQLESSLKSKIDHLINQLMEKEQSLEIIQGENEFVRLSNQEKERRIIELEEKAQELMNLMDNTNAEKNIEENNVIIENFKRELEKSNKNMIKMEAKYKSKMKNLQKRLDNFRTMSDVNAEVIKLENQVALLEEEKVSKEELQRQINELENQTSTQTNEIQKHIEAIAMLENQKLDLIQELHGVKQEMTTLETENAELENARVTAELKIVELEEQVEKFHNKNIIDNDNTMIIEDSGESGKIETIDKKSNDSTDGSTESFERIMDPSDGGIAVSTTETTLQSSIISQLNEKISYLTIENEKLMLKLNEIKEKIIDNEENYREMLDKLTLENAELIDNTRKNSIDKQTLMSLESEVIELKQLSSKQCAENVKLSNESVINRDNFELIQAKLNEQLSILESKLIEKNSTIESLKNNIDEKIYIINKLEVENANYNDKINELNINKNAMNEFSEEKMNYYNNMERELREIIEKLEIQIKDNNGEIKILNEKLSKMQLELDEKTILIDEYSSEQANRAIAVSKLMTDNEQLTIINSNLNHEINDIKMNEAKIIKQIEDYKLNIDNNNHEIEEKNAKICQLESNLENIKKQHLFNVDSLETMYNGMIENLKAENYQVKQEMNAIEEKIYYYQEELKRRDEVLREMNIKNDEHAKKELELDIKMGELINKIETLNRIITEKDEIITRNQDKINQLEDQLQIEGIKYSEQSDLYKKLLIQLENQTTSYDDIKRELSNTYQTVDQLKIKYEEDTSTLNEQLQSVRSDLNHKTIENGELKIILDEKEKIIGNNITNEMKITLENRISSLERELEDSQVQLHKMKVIAANLKRKTKQCQEYECKIREIEEKWTIEKQEKEEMNDKIYLLNKIKDENEETLKNAVSEMNNEKMLRDKLLEEFDDYKEKSLLEITEKDQELIDVREKARELDVRMQVMEAEYLEQLNTIQKCETEHRLLLSKLSEVNELLENTKIESATLQNQLECLHSEIDETKSYNNELLSKMDEYKKANDDLTRTNVELMTIKQDVNIDESKNITQPDNKKDESIIHDNESLKEIKLDDKDDYGEEWDWNNERESEAATSNIIGNLHHSFSPMETQLNAKIIELNHIINDLNGDKIQLNDKLKLIQAKNIKLIRKLKEYKIQNESLQQQLKIQLTSGELCNLDSAIEEELKCQVSRLEKNLQDIKNDNEKIVLERDNCLKKIDTLMAANERFLEIKERQDRDLEVMHITNDELMKKIQWLEVKVGGEMEKLNNENNQYSADIKIAENNEKCNKCKEKISELEESVESLAMENEELRKLIELEKNKLTEKMNEIQLSKIETEEELKSNFYEMLEKSHNIEKQCFDKLEMTNQDRINLEEDHRLNLIEANKTIHTLEETINEKQMMIEKYQVIIETDRINLNEKLQQLAEANKKIEEIEIDLKNEISKKQTEIQIMEKTIEKSCIDSNKLINELDDIKNEMEKLKIMYEEEIVNKESKIQNLEENIKVYHDKINDQTEIILELQRQLDEVKMNSELNLKKCHELEEKCYKDLENANQENMNVKHSHNVFVTESIEKTRELDEKLAENNDIIAEKDINIKIMEENLKLALIDGEKWRKDNHEIQQKFIEYNENMAAVTELLNVRVQEVADLRQYIQKLEFDKLTLEKRNINIDELNSKLIDKENEIISITAKHKMQMDEKLQEILNLQSEISMLHSERDENILKLNNQIQEMKLLKESINNSEKLINTLKSQVSMKDEEIQQHESKIVYLNKEIQQLTAIIHELETSSATVRDDLTEKISEITILQEKITELMSKNQHENDEHKSIEKQLHSELLAKDEEINDLRFILDESTYPSIIQKLQNKIDTLYEEKSQLEQSLLPNLKNLSKRQAQNVKNAEEIEINRDNSNEVDVALYMLHQRDVKIEELTHELIQLLEERDTLQLRLSNAIRINEDLRILLSPAATLKNREKLDDDNDAGVMINQETTTTTTTTMTSSSSSPPLPPSSLTLTRDNVQLPVAEQLQSTDSDQEKTILAQKLSQLRSVGHRKDVRLLDDRELRNTQQMSLITHKDALSTLPPDAAARIINSNYTLSREVQSQSSVLLNWLWGKSAAKVVHM